MFLSAFYLCLAVTLSYSRVNTLSPLYAMDSAYRIPSQYIVLLRESGDDSVLTKMSELQRFTASAGPLKTIRTYEFLNFRAALITAGADVIDALRHHQNVEAIEANQIVSVDDYKWKAQKDTGDCVKQSTRERIWGLSRISSIMTPAYNTASYKYNRDGGKGVYVYVVDSGVNVAHTDFNGRAKWGMTASDITDGNDDLKGHGTHVAGTIASATYGIAKEANIIAVKVLDGNGKGRTDITIEGLIWLFNDYRQKQAKDSKTVGVVNMSLGSPKTISVDRVVYQVADISGLSIVVSAGNDAVDACEQSPARVRTAITVGATDKNDKIAGFSNFGPCVDVFAPGVNILSTYKGNTEATTLMNGTSMAAPHVTGVIARYLSALEAPPSAQHVKAWVLDTAIKQKIEIPVQNNTIFSSPNRLLYIPCAFVPEESTSWPKILLILSSVILVFVAIMTIVVTGVICKAICA